MATPFKGYTRVPRVQEPEEDYNKGMYFTNTPLQPGFCKLMVNYDLKDNGAILSPRPALVLKELINYAAAPGITYTDSMFLVASMEGIEDDNLTYRQIIVGDPIAHKLYAITYKPGLLTANIVEIGANITFKTPIQAGIHNLQVQNVNNIARVPGSFAYNNSFFFFDNIGLRHTKLIGGMYQAEALTGRQLTPKEAASWGYNMLNTNPYTFANSISGVDIPVQLDGLLPYDLAGNLVLSPVVNQSILFKSCFKATTGKTYKLDWEWKEPGGTTWTLLKTETKTIALDTTFTCAYSAPNSAVMIRLTATNTGVATDAAVLVVGFDFSNKDQGNNKNAEQKVYDLKTSSIVAYWKNRIILAMNNILFLSEVNDPTYFPYPNNIETFNEAIIHVLPFLDNILVFTSNKLYSISMGPDGMTWFTKCIQSNLDIAAWDLHLIQAIKNMVFFKSGNYYYMVVPKASSTTGELTIAPISKAIEPLLNNFGPEVKSVLNFLYDYTSDIQLINYYNFIDFEDICNMYVFKTGDNRLLNLALLYNTLSRTWRAYTFESSQYVVPFKQDATKKGTYMSLVSNGNAPCIQFIGYDAKSAADTIRPGAIFKNYQLLDTGYRAIVEDYKKRFREAQLRFNNTSLETIQFYTDLLLDGDMRKSMFKYDIVQNLDPMDANYGVISMERNLVDPDIIPGTTILGAGDSGDVNRWRLDMSRFPEVMLWKVRIPMSGKGYAPRMRLISYSEKPYELLSNLWVYRQLYSR